MKNKLYIRSFLILMAISFHFFYDCTAQVFESNINNNSVTSLARNVGDDFLHVATAPLNMSAQDGLRLLALTAITTSFIALLDRPIDERFTAEGKKAMKNDDYFFLGRDLSEIGYEYNKIPSKYFLTGLSTSMIAGGLIFNDKKLLETTRIMIESYAISQSITAFGKGLFGRSRPYVTDNSNEFDLFKFTRNHKFRALPSGHTSGIFSMMTVIAKQYNRWWIKIPAYTLSVSVALQRIDNHQHWASDVILGGAIGYWVGSSLVNHNNSKSNRILIEPTVSTSSIGLSIHF